MERGCHLGHLAHLGTEDAWALRMLRHLGHLGHFGSEWVASGLRWSEMLWRAPARCPAGVCGSCLGPSLCEFAGTFHSAPWLIRP